MNGATCTIIESYIKQYHTSLVLFPEMQHFRADPFQASLKQFSIGVLTISHMYRVDPFTCTRPWVVVFRDKYQLSPPYFVVDSPNAVLAK